MTAMRAGLIALSRNRALQEAIVRIPLSRRMARRFVAGEQLSLAITAVLDLNARGMLATLDHLGESVTSADEAQAAVEDYVTALDALYLARARSGVSIKLTQMGLDLDDQVGEDFCYDNVSRILRKAAEYGQFVRIDMEDSSYTERTLVMYRRLRGSFENVGIVIQSYLRRSHGDVQALIDEGLGNFRLVKGAYDEPVAFAYPKRPQVTRAFQELIALCMTPASLKKKTFVAIASHDTEVVNFARAYAYRHEVPQSAYEFQTLYGIRRDLQARLVSQGDTVRIYVPYGTHWYPYFMRRLAERPANLLFFLRALTGS
jgi:proline dehydrogenase